MRSILNDDRMEAFIWPITNDGLHAITDCSLSVGLGLVLGLNLGAISLHNLTFFCTHP